MSEATGPRIEPTRFRAVLGHLATSVCVVTTCVDGEPYGATVGSFTSVSLDPPLVAFFMVRASSTLGAVQSTGRFVVNVLAEGQEDVCGTFAGRAPDRFAAAAWSKGRLDMPLLHDALAVVDCDVEQISQVGDHDMILGRVVDLHVQRTQTAPLVFWRGGLRGLSRAPEAPVLVRSDQEARRARES